MVGFLIGGVILRLIEVQAFMNIKFVLLISLSVLIPIFLSHLTVYNISEELNSMRKDMDSLEIRSKTALEILKTSAS